MKTYNSGFTLIEILVAVSILSIVMISIFATFILVWDINNKVEASRVMQENLKNTIEIISEDFRKNWVNKTPDFFWTCDENTTYTNWYFSESKACIWENEYFLAKNNFWTYSRVTDMDDCLLWEDRCDLVLKDSGWSISPLNNSWVTFRSLEFIISESNPKRLTIIFEASPAFWKWIKTDLIEENTIKFQTTISHRIYDEYN